MTANPPLTPLSLEALLGRVAHEWASRRRIFDLPTARFFDVSSGPDLAADFMGRRAATPIGPAAGPHSQLAGNIVLAWLGGARVFELKTVQIIDELEINRPCIDMQTIGFNIEWSQELKIAQSLGGVRQGVDDDRDPARLGPSSPPSSEPTRAHTSSTERGLRPGRDLE
jgi:putative selenate reductase